MPMNNNNIILTDSDIDAAGEILGIGMGSAANTISSILDKPVSIAKNSAVRTTGSELDLTAYNRGIFVDCNYTAGIVGKAGMLFTADSVCKILNVLMSTDLNADAPDFQFDEMGTGTIQEIFNMMMQTFTRTIGEFVNAAPEMELTVNLFSPDAMKSNFEIADDTEVTAVNFSLDISGVVESKFDFLIPTVFASSLKEKLVEMGMSVPTQADSAAPVIPPQAESAAPVLESSQPEPVAISPQANSVAPVLESSQVEPVAMAIPTETDYNAYYEYYQQYYQQYGYQTEEDDEKARILKATEERNKPKIAEFPTFSLDTPTVPNAFMKDNMNMLMDVKVEVVAEMGKVRRKMKDIMEFEVGTVIELDKSAGAPCDIIVNTQHVGRGDIVVLNENFCIRIVDIYNTYGEQKKKSSRR
jgi:flagellar motor switch protein FliN/FliY